MLKKLVHVACFIMLLCAAFAASPASASDTNEPNVLWIYLEDVSPWFSCYGDEVIETPHIDSLAADGIRFTRYYSPAGVCSATRSALMLGAMQTTFGVHNHRSSRNNAKGTKHDGVGMIHLPEDVLTLPEIFRQHGYFSIGGGVKDDYNFVFNLAELYDHRGKGFGPRGREEDYLWKSAPEGKPWFLQVHLRGGKLGRAAKPTIKLEDVRVPPYYPDIELVRKAIAHHYDCILETDRQVGELIQGLKDEGLYDNTVIFLHSDHGYKLHRDKQFLYEGGIHMPLIVAGPRIEQGQTRTDLISGIDISAASLAVAGIEIPQHMEGRNFLAADYSPRSHVIAARDRCDFTIEHIRAVVTPRFKYLKNYLTDRPYMQPSYKDPWPVSKEFRRMMAAGEMNEAQLTFFGPTKPDDELYDLTSDPDEIHNLANDPAYQEQLEQHRKLLADWIAVTGDKGQEPESDEGLLQVYYQYRNKCVNPEYKRVAHLAEPKPDRTPRRGKKRSID